MRYKSALAKADEICVRDAYSKQVVEKCYARTPLSYPDVVFLYGKEKKTHDKFIILLAFVGLAWEKEKAQDNNDEW